MTYKYEHMLVDSKNCIYRAIHAGLADPNFMKTKADFVVVYFRFLSAYINKFRPRSVHFFWDVPKEEVWRRELYKEYKDGREHKVPEAEEYLRRTSEIVRGLMPYINSREYICDRQEADDLIYAFCKLNPKKKIIIISSDGDFKQLAHYNLDIDLYNPLAKKIRIYDRSEDIDPVEEKCLTGDKSDNLNGYDQIGEVRARQVVADFKFRKELFKKQGSDLYDLNRKLIDLSLCPYISKNMIYVADKLSEDVKFSYPNIVSTIQKYKVKGLMSEMSKTILSFKFLEK
jgi:DNA polymerase-1